MAIFPTFVGQTDPPWTITCQAESDSGVLTPLDLTGYTVLVEVAIAPSSGDPTFTAGGGSVTTSQLSNGIVIYTPNGSEWSADCTGVVQVKATKGSAVKKFDYIYGPVLKGS